MFTDASPPGGQWVAWIPGQTEWLFTSSRDLKENFESLDHRQILAKVAALPLTRWNYKGHEQKHIGPMAQDFHAAFGLGGSEITIDGGDLHGIALVAIQGLYQELQDAKAQNVALEKRLAQMEKQMQAVSYQLHDLQAAQQTAANVRHHGGM